MFERNRPMEVFEAICIEDWHVEAENGDRQECKRGKLYTISEPDGHGTVTLFSGFWVKAPARIFAGARSIYEKRRDMNGTSCDAAPGGSGCDALDSGGNE